MLASAVAVAEVKGEGLLASLHQPYSIVPKSEFI